MEQRPLGKTGLSVSALGFGCGNVGGLMVRGSFDDQVAAVQRALAAGITYFDTAPSYGAGRSEENLGRVLNHLGVWDRVVVGTKLRLGTADLDDPKTAVRVSVRESLARLGHDHVDLLQLHNHITDATDGESVSLEHVAMVADAMRQVVDEGLVRHIGFTGIGEANALHSVIGQGRFETVQSYFNALNPSSGYAGRSGGAQDLGGLIDLAASNGVGVIVIRVMAAGALVANESRAPLAGGTGGALLTGSEYERDIQRAGRLLPVAQSLGLENGLELSFRFALAKPGVSTVLVGYSDQDQLESAIRWAERGPLSADAVQQTLDLSGPQAAAP